MDVFAALAEPTRRDIIQMLASRGSLPSSAIAQKFRSTPSAISQHLKILREARLVKVEKKAQQRIYSVDPASIAQVEAWIKDIQKNWDERFNRLDKLLKEGG